MCILINRRFGSWKWCMQRNQRRLIKVLQRRGLRSQTELSKWKVLIDNLFELWSSKWIIHMTIRFLLKCLNNFCDWCLNQRTDSSFSSKWRKTTNLEVLNFTQSLITSIQSISLWEVWKKVKSQCLLLIKTKILIFQRMMKMEWENPFSEILIQGWSRTKISLELFYLLLIKVLTVR